MAAKNGRGRLFGIRPTSRSEIQPASYGAELHAYLHDQGTYAGLKAQSYEQRTVGGLPQFEESMHRRIDAQGRGQLRVHAARRALEATPGGVEAWGVLRLAYGPRELDDHFSAHDEMLAPLLRLTDAVQSEAASRWTEQERWRLLDAGVVAASHRGHEVRFPEEHWSMEPGVAGLFRHRSDFWKGALELSMSAAAVLLHLDDSLFVLPSSPSALRSIQTEVIEEASHLVMYGDEDGVVMGAKAQAQAMLAGAETAYLAVMRELEREAAAQRLEAM